MLKFFVRSEIALERVRLIQNKFYSSICCSKVID